MNSSVMKNQNQPTVWNRSMIIILILSVISALLIWQYFNYKIIQLQYETPASSLSGHCISHPTAHPEFPMSTGDLHTL